MSEHIKIKKGKDSPGVPCSDGASYPYGTCICLEDDMVDDLDMDNLAVGDVVEIKGYAFVDSKSERSSKNSTNKSIRLQMTSMKVDREEDDVVKQMYGE